MEEARNIVQLRGEAVQEPALSHENHGQRFYRFLLSVRRLSGQADLLPVIATEEQLKYLLPLKGRRLVIEGQLRSFNNKSGQGSRLVISVLARTPVPYPGGGPQRRDSPGGNLQTAGYSAARPWVAASPT